MKKLMCYFLSRCFPMREFEPPWRAMLSLSIVRPPPKHWKMRKIVEEPLLLAHSNGLLTVALSLAITALGAVILRLFLP